MKKFFLFVAFCIILVSEVQALPPPVLPTWLEHCYTDHHRAIKTFTGSLAYGNFYHEGDGQINETGVRALYGTLVGGEYAWHRSYRLRCNILREDWFHLEPSRIIPVYNTEKDYPIAFWMIYKNRLTGREEASFALPNGNESALLWFRS